MMGACGWVSEENFSGRLVSALSKHLRATLEAQRGVRIIGAEFDTDAAVPVRGLRPAVLCVRFADGRNAI